MSDFIDTTIPGFSLVLGGARSGKSVFAESVIENVGGGIYLATSEPRDAEMTERIEAHRLRRGDQWRTIEEPLDVVQSLSKINENRLPVLVDCLTLWLSNLMELEKDIDAEIKSLCTIAGKLNFHTIFVSNEVGHGITPDNPLARQFIDCAGLMNQQIAKVSTNVIFVAAGIPQKIK